MTRARKVQLRLLRMKMPAWVKDQYADTPSRQTPLILTLADGSVTTGFFAAPNDLDNPCGGHAMREHMDMGKPVYWKDTEGGPVVCRNVKASKPLAELMEMEGI